MEVLIVSKTKMGTTKACLGGITFPDLQSLRLLDNDGKYHPVATSFEIGQSWDIDFKPAQKIILPHSEDVLIISKKKLKEKKQIDYNWLVQQKKLKDRVWKGPAKELFAEMVKWTGNRNGYIAAPNIPNLSTGFWIPDQDLSYDKKHYSYRSTGAVKKNFNLAYVGFQAPIDIIPAGTITRVSLAKWWKPEDIEIEERCYLQLSGWYD